MRTLVGALALAATMMVASPQVSGSYITRTYRIGEHEVGWFFEVEVPAGALPPGPAEAAAVPVSSPERFRHVVRFEVQAGRPARFRLHFNPSIHESAGTVRVVVRGTGGQTWEAAYSEDARRFSPARFFVGDAEDLDAFTRRLPSTPRDRARNRLPLRAPADLDGAECAWRRATEVVAAAPVSREVLLDCAARGARVALVGRSLAGDFAQRPPGEPFF